MGDRGESTALLCVEDVAQMLNVAPQTVYKWVRTGYIPHFKLGKSVRFSREAVFHWLSQREVQGRSTFVPKALDKTLDISKSGIG